MKKKRTTKAEFQSIFVAGEPRTASLHCHVSRGAKAWLVQTSKKTGKPMGQLVDEIITRVVHS